MANLSAYLGGAGSSVAIGEYLSEVLVGNLGGNAILNDESGDFIKTGKVYLQNDYPRLYEIIGLVGASKFRQSSQSTNIITSRGTRVYFDQNYYISGSAGAGSIHSTSTDLTTWTTYTAGTTLAECVGIEYGNSLYVITYKSTGTADTVKTSTDAITWTSVTVLANINSLTFGNGIFVIGSNTGGIRTSTNGSTWTSQTSGTSSNILSVGYGNNLYLYGGVSGILSTSTDGVTWSSRTSGTTEQINTLGYFNGLYLYGGNAGTLSTSTDGVTWSSVASGTTSNILSISYSNGVYMYSTTNGGFATSADAITWRRYSSGITTSIGHLYSDGTKTIAPSYEQYSPIFDSENVATKFYSSFYNPDTEMYVPINTLDRAVPGNLVAGLSSCSVVSYIRAK
jgi:hypothetical protein